MSKSTLKKDYFWNTIGVFAQNAISPLLLIVVTRINGIYDSGLFSFAFSVSVIFLALGMWGGRTFQVSDTKKQFSSLNYITIRMILSVVMFVGALTFCIINSYDLFKSSLIIGLVVVKMLETVSDAIYGTMQVGKKLYISGRALLLKALLGFIFFVVIDIVAKNIFLATSGLIIANLIILFCYDIPQSLTIDKDIFKIKYKSLRKLFNESITAMRVSSPVFLITFMAMFSLNIPRYFIDKFFGAEIGYFGILAMPITLVSLAISFLLQPKMVDLAEAYNGGRRDVLKKDIKFLLTLTAIVSFAILVATYYVGVPLLELVFGIEFNTYKTALMIIVFGAVLNAYVAIYMNLVIIARKFKIPTAVFIVSNIALILLCAVYVVQYGLIGGVALYTIINGVQMLLLGAYCTRIVAGLHENA